MVNDGVLLEVLGCLKRDQVDVMQLVSYHLDRLATTKAFMDNGPLRLIDLHVQENDYRVGRRRDFDADPDWSEMIAEVRTEVVPFLDVFGNAGLLLSDRRFSQTAREFIAKFRVYNIRELHMHFIGNILLASLYYLDGTSEKVSIDPDHIETAIPLLHSHVAVDLYSVFIAPGIGQNLLSGFRHLGPSFFVKDMIALEPALVRNQPATLALLDGIAKSKRLLVARFQRRHSYPYEEFIKKLQLGQLDRLGHASAVNATSSAEQPMTSGGGNFNEQQRRGAGGSNGKRRAVSVPPANDFPSDGQERSASGRHVAQRDGSRIRARSASPEHRVDVDVPSESGLTAGAGDGSPTGHRKRAAVVAEAGPSAKKNPNSST